MNPSAPGHERLWCAATGAVAEPTNPSSARQNLELEAIYREQSGFVWRNARRLGCDRGAADDVVHQVFLVVARRLPEFRREAGIRTWLFAITRRVVQQFFRDSARRGAQMQRYASENVDSFSASSNERVDAAEYLWFLLSRIGEAKRVVFILSELEGMTTREIAEYLGVLAPTVQWRLRAARRELTKMVEHEAARG